MQHFWNYIKKSLKANLWKRVILAKTMVMLVVLEIFEFVIVSISLINFSRTKQLENGKKMLGFWNKQFK
jgi:hypothetical protein